MPDDIERIVIELVAQRKGLDPALVPLDATFAELGIDSLDGLELMFSLEDRFGIDIPDHVAQGIRSVRDIVSALHREDVRCPGS